MICLGTEKGTDLFFYSKTVWRVSIRVNKINLSPFFNSVSPREISFGSSCGVGRCRPDIVAKAPDGSLRIIEVKTGDAGLNIRQSEIFPQIRDGSSIPRGDVAREFGLIPGKPLKEQGYPNGIPIEELHFPGAKK